MEKVDLYDYPTRFQNALSKVTQSDKICDENKKDIVAFSKVKLAKGCSYGRVAKVVYCIRFLAIWLGKSFRQASKDDLIALIGDLETKNFAEYTKYDFKVVLKMYFKWLKGNDEVFPPEVTWLRKNMKNLRHKLPDEMLTEEDVLNIANCSEHPRDKALILVLYECGCRIGELLSLRIKNVEFDQYGAVLRVTGKTGDRRVRIISSAPVLAAWLNVHPERKSSEALVWCSRTPNHRDRSFNLRHATIYKLIKTLAKRAGITKAVYPHLFRHSRATSMAGKFTEAQMKEYFGWVQGSDMAATYVHLSGRDVDDALLKLHGLVRSGHKQEEKLRVRDCSRCKEHNSPISQFCTKCGLPLDNSLIETIEHDRKASDGMMNKLMEDKEFRELMMKKIFEMGLDKAL